MRDINGLAKIDNIKKAIKSDEKGIEWLRLKEDTFIQLLKHNLHTFYRIDMFFGPGDVRFVRFFLFPSKSQSEGEVEGIHSKSIMDVFWVPSVYCFPNMKYPDEAGVVLLAFYKWGNRRSERLSLTSFQMLQLTGEICPICVHGEMEEEPNQVYLSAVWGLQRSGGGVR